MQLTPEEKMINARTQLLLHHPFFGYFLTHLKFAGDALNLGVSTACVEWDRNAKKYLSYLHYNPDFISMLSVEEVQGVEAHEMMHILLQNEQRKENRDEERWAHSCLIPSSLVSGNYKPIEQIQKGDRVLGETGSFSSIQATFSAHYNGPMFTIKAIGLLPFTVTPNHLVKVARSTRNCYPIHLSPLEWVKADKIDTKSYLAIPRIREGSSPNILPVDEFKSKMAREHGYSHSINPLISQGVPLNADTAWLMGLYVAEGSPSRKDGSEVKISLNSSELEVASRARRVFELLGYKASLTIENESNSLWIKSRSIILGKAFASWFGRGAHNKRIPEFILTHSNRSITGAFLEGYFQGDGFVSRGNKMCSTASKVLASQLQLLIARFGELATIQEMKQLPRKFGQEELPAGQIYGLTWRPLRAKTRIMGGSLFGKDRQLVKTENHEVIGANRRWKVSGSYILVPVVRVEKTQYDGLVYDLQTTDHSYLVSNAVVHNCEIAVNDTVLNAGFSLPRREDFSPILPDQTTHNKTVEEIYDLLPHKKEAINEGKKFAHVIFSDKQPDGDSRSGTIDGIDEKKLKEIISEAAAYARSHGKLPAGMERWIDDYLTPKMNWLHLLDHYIYNAMTTMTYSWTRPNRRIPRSKLYLPSTVRYGFELVVCVDSSGSISTECLSQFASEIKSIVNSIQGCTAHVIVCDADLYSIYDDIDKSNLEQLKFGGGGGTNFNPALEKAEELNPRVCVYLTDGDGEYPKEEPSFPVIWVITPDGVQEEQVPFGSYVKIPH